MELVVGQAVDELAGQVELARPDLRRLPAVDLAEVAHLVGEVHGVEHEAALRRPDEHEALLAAHDELRERDAPLLFHRVSEEPIRLVAALVRPEEIRPLEVDRIDRLERHELGDVDHLRGVALELLQLVVGDPHILVLRELVAAHERRAIHDLVVHRAEGLLLDARAALGVQHVEGDARRRGGGVHPDGDRDQSERDRARADRVRRHGLHDSTMVPMMREGSTPSMDSVPEAVERQDIGAPGAPRPPLVWLVRFGTVLASVILVSFIVLMAWLQFSGSRLEAVEEPERALALIVGRTMDIDEAVAHAPAWEQFVYRVLSSDPSEDVEEGLRWYEELARESAHPSIDLHLAILEGEARRTDRVRRASPSSIARCRSMLGWADSRASSSYQRSPSSTSSEGSLDSTRYTNCSHAGACATASSISIVRPTISASARSGSSTASRRDPESCSHAISTMNETRMTLASTVPSRTSPASRGLGGSGAPISCRSSAAGTLSMEGVDPSRIIGTIVLSCKPWRRTRSARGRSRSDSSRFPSGCTPPPRRRTSPSTCSTPSAARASSSRRSAPSTTRSSIAHRSCAATSSRRTSTCGSPTTS